MRIISTDRDFALWAAGPPCGNAVTAQNNPDRLRVAVRHFGNVEAELETGPAPRHPQDSLAKAGSGESLAVYRGGQSYPSIGVEMVDIGQTYQRMHRGVDRGGGTTFTVQAEVEGGHHLVFAIGAGVDVDQRPQPVEAEHSQPTRGQRAEVPARAFDVKQLGGRPVTGSSTNVLQEVLPPA